MWQFYAAVILLPQEVRKSTCAIHFFFHYSPTQDAETRSEKLGPELSTEPFIVNTWFSLAVMLLTLMSPINVSLFHPS